MADRLRGGRWGTAVAGLMLALFLVALDQTVVGTALPQIVANLEGFERYAWVTTAYLLASTAMIPVIGKLGDELSGGHEGDERERAAHASKTVIRPLAERGTDKTR